jgi:SAM-dependent methyltransferase
MTGRSDLAQLLQGSGVELGPGNLPFPVPYTAHVVYVDRCKPDSFAALFPEFAGSESDGEFPAIDVYADLDTDGLSAFADASQDFVVCSHVLEHLAAPLALMDEMHRVLKPGGVLILLLPDRRRTFDRYRASTSLDHLIREHRNGVRTVDDDHLFDFITLAEPFTAYTHRPDDWTRDRFYVWHRERSIHVHCWTEDDFEPVLDYCVRSLHQHWETEARLELTDDGFEFGYALRKRTIRAGELLEAARRRVALRRR